MSFHNNPYVLCKELHVEDRKLVVKTNHIQTNICLTQTNVCLDMIWYGCDEWFVIHDTSDSLRCHEWQITLFAYYCSKTVNKERGVNYE